MAMIADWMRQASERHRAILEQTYKGCCTVWERKPVMDPETKLTDPKAEVMVLENQPCRLSFRSSPAASGKPAAEAGQEIRLFLSPDIPIRPGSRICVVQDNLTADYAASGRPAVYASHQEITLEIWKGWT